LPKGIVSISNYRKAKISFDYKGGDMYIRENSIVYTPARIGPVEIKNRLVRSATYENAATSGGEVSEFLFDLYRTLPKGGVGLIITGVASVYPKALQGRLGMRADDDSFILSLKKILRVEDEGDVDQNHQMPSRT
jgi:2,4-dienoyl-CoA reductase-like NADH-dependent reductase (Old Yellow Enzyme family)